MASGMTDPTGGRAELDRLLADHSARTVRLAGRVAKIVAKAVTSGEDPDQAVRAAMEAVGMAKAVRDTVATAVVQAVCVGYGIWPSVSALSPEAMGSLRKTALSGVWDDSGMTLSARLHGTDQAMRAEIVQAIKDGVDAKATVWDTQRRIYDGYGFGGVIRQAKLSELPKDLRDLANQARKVLTPEDYAQLQADAKRLRAYADRLATAPLKAAYGQMADRLEKGLTKGLDRLVQTATEEKARYHASRIQRTESANAWGQGFVQECAENPDVVGIKWNLSSSHKIFDICDFNHTANLYGMGPGVYPKAKLPRYCAHPHCHCPLLKVFVGTVPPERDQVEAGGKAALNGMTDSQRARLLTLKGKDSFGQSGKWQGSLRGWGGKGSAAISKGAKDVLAQAQQLELDLQPSFVMPKTVREAEAFVRGMGIEAKLDGMALSYAQVTAKTLHDLVVVKGLPKFDLIQFDPRESGSLFAMGGPSAYMKIGRSAGIEGEWEREKLAANLRQRSDWELWNSLSEDIKPKVPEPAKRAFVTETLADTITHEFGHHIHALAMGRDGIGAIKETEIPGYLEFIGEPPLDRPINWRRRPQAGRSQQVKVRGILSDYATTNVFETFAEAFNAKYSKGEALPEEWERVIQSAVDKAKLAAGSGT